MTLPADMFQPLISPGKSMNRSVEAPGRIKRAALTVSIMGFLYALTSLGLGASGGTPIWPTLPGLGVDNYYFWQMLLILPGFLAVWAISAALLGLLVGVKAGRGGFGKALAVTGPALSGPLFVAWVPPAFQAAFMALGMRQGEWVAILSDPGPWQTVYLAFYALAGLLALRLFVAASAVLAKRTGPRTIMSGLAVSAFVLAAYVALVR